VRIDQKLRESADWVSAEVLLISADIRASNSLSISSFVKMEIMVST
jgi:hypothetical protein